MPDDMRKKLPCKKRRGGAAGGCAAQRDDVVSLRKRIRALTRELNALKSHQDETIQKERLHALGQMASGMVHDFNNALTPILGASDFLVMNPQMLDQRADVIKLLESIRTSAHDAKSMVMRLREFYRPKEDMSPHAVDMNSIIDEVILLTRPKWREEALSRNTKIKIRTELAGIPPIMASDSQMREMLMNLVLNSCDAIEHEGTIIIRTMPAEGSIVLRVSDTGKGMSEEVRRRCFEPFFSTKGRNGTGMGLAMVYGIIKKYHGDIKIESEVDKGAAFEITIPVPENSNGVARAVEQANPPVAPSRVLLYDSDALSRRVFAKFLRCDGHHVESAATMRDALKKAGANEFDIVMVDVVVPDGGGNGICLAKELKTLLPRAKSILLSGSASFQKDDAGKLEGVDVVLAKPATFSELREAINKVSQKIETAAPSTSAAPAAQTC